MAKAEVKKAAKAEADRRRKPEPSQQAATDRAEASPEDAAGAEDPLWLLDRLLQIAATPFTHQLTGLVERGGVEVNAVGWSGQTALAVAAAKGRAMQVAELLRLGAAPSLAITNSRGWTPLMLAAANGHAAVATALLEADTVHVVHAGPDWSCVNMVNMANVSHTGLPILVGVTNR